MAKVGSAAYVVSIVVVTGVILGALMMTVLDPFAQALFDSTMFTSTTVQGSNATRWQTQAWAFVPMSILLYFLVLVWTKTRRT